LEVRAIKLSPIDLFRLSFLISFVALAAVVAAYILFVGSSLPGSANIIMEGSDSGDGTLDIDVVGDSQRVRMMAHNSSGASLSYRKTSTKPDDGGSSEMLTADMSLEKGDGSRQTKFVVTNKNKDAGANIFVDRMKGGFSGQAEAWISYYEDNGSSFDLNYNIEGENKSWHGTFYALDESGRPTTGETVRGTGNFTERRHYNVTNPPQTSEDFLWFCAGINRDVIISDEPNAVYIAPDGYTVDKDGILWKDDTGYYIDESGNRTIINTTEQA
jgi:hypothetical protein